MRISDWSSDVCSSDLNYGSTGVNLENKRTLVKLDWNISDYRRASLTYQETKEFRPSPYDAYPENVVLSSHWYNIDNITKNTSLQLFSDWTDNFSTEIKLSHQKFDQVNGNPIDQPEVEIERSEEHTSELQSLMRISYAVFCLNKTNP